MQRRGALSCALAGLLMAGGAAAEVGPDWRPWSAAALQQARAEGRLVLVDLVAEWCAYCKKMDATTWRDPLVLDAIAQGYVPVRADPDKDRDLPAHFADHARPTTLILDADGKEILKKQGYLKPEWMLWMLQAVSAERLAAGNR